MPLPFEFDHRNPDYSRVFAWRLDNLKRLRQEPSKIAYMRAYYRDHPEQFINDWGMTFDPRNIEVGLPAMVPFVLFAKQEDWVTWLIEHWRARKPGLTEKSRDMGLSWLTVATASTLCLHYESMVIGFGSRKEEYVDKIDGPKSLFFKARMFISMLPREFRGGWDAKRHAPFMRISFPETGSYMSGEAGDNIGRGDRTAIYIVDESAYLERPQLVDASLSATTNCRQDISSVNGMGNSFAERRHSGKIDVFTFHWTDDPRKDEAWYQKQVDELPAVVVAQEIDINYSASAVGIVIPSEWITAAVEAHLKLNLTPHGIKQGALDVADEGTDLNAYAGRHDFLLEHIESWSGVGSDIFGTAQRAELLTDTLGYQTYLYDADGLGSGIRGDARIINEGRVQRGQRTQRVDPFRGSGAVVDPEGSMVPGRTNDDFFENAKAQAWWALRLRFQRTYRWVIEGIACEPADIISISKGAKEWAKLVRELSQPTYSLSKRGRIIINKSPDGLASPNHADAAMIAFAPNQNGFTQWDKLL